MKRIVLLILLCAFVAHNINAQISERTIRNAVEKALREHEAKQKKMIQEKQKTEQRHERLQAQQKHQFNQQIKNINSFNSGDFMRGPQQQVGNNGTQVATLKAEETNRNPVANQEKEIHEYNRNNRQVVAGEQKRSESTRQWANGNVSSEGTDYIANQELHNQVHKFRGGYPNNQGQQPNRPQMSSNEMKKQYPSAHNAAIPPKIMLRGEKKPARVMGTNSSQKKIDQLSGGAITRKSPPQHQAPIKEKTISQQKPEKQNEELQRSNSFQSSIRKDKHGVIIIDGTPSVAPRSSSSTDLAVVDITNKKKQPTNNNIQKTNNASPQVGSLADKNKGVSLNEYMTANQIHGLSAQQLRQKINEAMADANMKELESLTNMVPEQLHWSSKTVTK